jgi:hypothetical protein
MTTESQAISHLRALIKDPLGHVAEACLFLARVDHIADAGEMVVDGWQPIETAPKDETVIILGRRMHDFGFIRGYGYFEGKPGSFLSGWITTGFDPVMSNLGLAAPTHWMPLPKPPENKEQIA